MNVLLRRILWVVVGGSSLASCSASSGSSTDGCDPPISNKCIDRAEAWTFVQSQGQGGASGAGGSGGAASVPEGCPGQSVADRGFLSHFEMQGDHLTAVPTQQGETCCYATSPSCEGRPLFIDGAQRAAWLRGGEGWGLGVREAWRRGRRRGSRMASSGRGARPSATMRAVSITKAGGPEVLAVVEHATRAAGPGEVRIHVEAAAVNPTDTLLRQGGRYGKDFPVIPGMDAAGVIESVGPGVERLKVGERVMAVVSPRRPEGGAQAELLVVPAASVVTIPEGATLAQASTLPMNGLTALLALDLMKLTAGQTLAVSGGAGLLAHFMIVLAKRRGLRVIADAKASETELVRGYGADVVVARGDRFADEVRAVVPDGVDALFDTALLGRASFGALRDGGVYVPVRGWDDGDSDRGIAIRPVFVSQALERTDWLSELRDLASSGAITLRVAGEYPPERAADAHRAMEAGGLRGRAVIVF